MKGKDPIHLCLIGADLGRARSYQESPLLSSSLFPISISTCMEIPAFIYSRTSMKCAPCWSIIRLHAKDFLSSEVFSVSGDAALKLACHPCSFCIGGFLNYLRSLHKTSAWTTDLSLRFGYRSFTLCLCCRCGIRLWRVKFYENPLGWFQKCVREMQDGSVAGIMRESSAEDIAADRC